MKLKNIINGTLIGGGLLITGIGSYNAIGNYNLLNKMESSSMVQQVYSLRNDINEIEGDLVNTCISPGAFIDNPDTLLYFNNSVSKARNLKKGLKELENKPWVSDQLSENDLIFDNYLFDLFTIIGGVIVSAVGVFPLSIKRRGYNPSELMYRE